MLKFWKYSKFQNGMCYHHLFKGYFHVYGCLLACVYTQHVCSAQEVKNRASDAIELELHMVINNHVGTGN